MVQGLYEGYSIGIHDGMFGQDVSRTYYTCPQYKAVLQKAINLGFRLPSINQQILQDQLMWEWITNGSFTKADLIYCLANDAGLDFARINWKNPERFMLTNVGTDPVKFMLNYGPYTNTESLAFGCLDTLWSPSIGVNFTLNNNCLISSTKSFYGSGGLRYRTAASGDQVAYWVLDGQRTFLNNNAVTSSTATPYDNLNWMNRRTAAAVSNLVYNNAGVATTNISSVLASGTRSATKLGILGDMHNINATILALGVPMEALFVGGALTDTEFIDYDNALATYLSKIRSVGALHTSGNYTVPAGITQILVECWGGGGAGRGYTSVAQTTTGGGGGGGAYAASLINVTPGQVIPYVIGAGGVGGTGAGPAGGDTSWNGGVILAKGGAGAPASTAKAAGGLASTSVGTIKYNGGSGGAGGGVLAISTGSGGSGAGSLGDGITGIDAYASAISTRPYYKMLGPGPPGYSIGSAGDLPGIPGMTGSGGGGARRVTGARNGGNGGQGYIRISAPKQY